MGTASTKSQTTKWGAQKSGARSGRNDSEIPPPEILEMSQRTWLIIAGAILLLAAILRLYDLDLVPVHHDEGVNGNFLVRLVREGQYQYDPQNYHGPTLYYFAAIFPWIMRALSGQHGQNTYGLTTTAIRMVPALFGLGTVALIFTLRRNLGVIATLGGALLLSVSPGAVYLSRYFIHETMFVFFTFGIVVCGLKYYESGHWLYLVLLAISAALLFATKETAIISVGVLVIALAMTLTFCAVRSCSPKPAGTRKGRNQRSRDREQLNFLERAGGPTSITVWVVVAIAVFIAVNVLFYSSFFTNYPKGVSDALKTFEYWTKTGKEAHVHPFITYVWWLLLQEAPLLLLGAVGAMLCVLKPRKPFAFFSALWAFGLLAAYSLIAYKTPWLALNFVVPLALISGAAIEWIYHELREYEVSRRVRVLTGVVVLLVATSVMPGLARIVSEKNLTLTAMIPGTAKAVINNDVHWKTFIPEYQTIDLNFYNYDNDNRYYVYVYAHTRRELHQLLDEVDRVAKRTRQGGQTGITIVSPDYWPLPWYLRDYSRVGYFGRMTPSSEPIIIAKVGQAPEVEATFGDRYQKVHSGFNAEGSFALRPGVDLLLYTRRELAP